MIELTVALPVWNSEKITWLVLESLCNQKKIDFKWELIIMEEEKKAFGADKVREFVDRLKAIGCESIKYCALEYRIPLPQKWKQIGELASESSKVFVFCAADDYYEPLKLSTCYKAIKNGFDWVQYRYCLMFDLDSKKRMFFDCKSIGRECGNLMACRTEDARKLPHSEKTKGVDGWLFQSIKPSDMFTDESDNWKQGFATDGLNNISLYRRTYYQNVKLPFFNTDIEIKDLLSLKNYVRLIALK